MSIVKSIYKIKPQFHVLNQANTVVAHIIYEGITYTGTINSDNIISVAKN